MSTHRTKISMVLGVCALAIAFALPASPAGAACRTTVASAPKASAGGTLTVPFVACKTGTYTLRLVYVSGGPADLKRGAVVDRKTVKVKKKGVQTYGWSLGSIAPGRYRLSLKLPNGKSVKGTGSVVIS